MIDVMLLLLCDNVIGTRGGGGRPQKVTLYYGEEEVSRLETGFAICTHLFMNKDFSKAELVLEKHIKYVVTERKGNTDFNDIKEGAVKLMMQLYFLYQF